MLNQLLALLEGLKKLYVGAEFIGVDEDDNEFVTAKVTDTNILIQANGESYAVFDNDQYISSYTDVEDCVNAVMVLLQTEYHSEYVGMLLAQVTKWLSFNGYTYTFHSAMYISWLNQTVHIDDGSVIVTVNKPNGQMEYIERMTMRECEKWLTEQLV